MIMSALRLAYKDKKEQWFDKPFLQSASGATKYWISVMRRRVQIWKAQQQRAEASFSTLEHATNTIQNRIKQKIADLEKAKKKKGKKVNPITINTDSSDSDTDDVGQ